METESRVNFTSATRRALGDLSVPANVGILAVAFAALTYLIGASAEKLGAAFNGARSFAAFGHQVTPPVTFTSAELGALFAAIVVWIWLFICIGLTDIMLEAAEVSEYSRNRFEEKVQPGIVRFMWISGPILFVTFAFVFVDLFLH